MKIYRAIGLMSGTSLDGMDAALIETDGEQHIARHGFLSLPYDEDFKAQMRACFNLTGDDVQKTTSLAKILTEKNAALVQKLLEQSGWSANDIDLIGFHGQTISHAPERGITIQIGDGALLAQLTGIDVVNDFRTNDVKAGGQGAPLVPIYHAALGVALDKPVAFLNIGGVANVTFVGGNEELLAFDTGPGNALIDDWMLQKTGVSFDKGGGLAAQGVVDEAVLAQLLDHAFFAQRPPKSLDRNAFSVSSCARLSAENGAATLTAFTAAAIERAMQFLPHSPKSWIVAGGGRHNVTLMQMLEKRLNAPMINIDTLNMNGDAIEAEAFAYLAVRSVRGLPISFPDTTGVPSPMTGGKHHTKTRAA